MYRPDPLDSSKGRCGAYVHRPLLCRLFGFSSRRHKYDQIELSTCSTIREKFPEACARADIGIAAGMSFPVFQEAFMRVASLDASLGNRVFPINRAIREALEYLYWKKPLTRKYARVS